MQAQEFRIDTDIEGVTKIIGELQALQIQLQTFQNMSEMLNTVIKNNTRPKEEINFINQSINVQIIKERKEGKKREGKRGNRVGMVI